MFFPFTGFWYRAGDTGLIIGFDGVCIFKSSSLKAWVILALNTNLPPSERFKLENIFCLGILFSEVAPYAEALFDLLVDDLNAADSEFVVEDFDGNEVLCSVRTTAIVLDMEAYWQAANMSPYGQMPCGTCGQHKESTPRLFRTKGGKVMKSAFPVPTTDFQPDPGGDIRLGATSPTPHPHPHYRTRASWELLVRRITESGIPNAGGVKGPCALQRLKHFRFPQALIADSMHSLYTHVVPEFRKHWFDEKLQVR